MSYYELETQQGLLPVRLGRWSVKSDYPSTNLWDYVYAPRVRGGFVSTRHFRQHRTCTPHGCGEGLQSKQLKRGMKKYAPRVRGGFVGLGFNAQT